MKGPLSLLAALVLLVVSERAEAQAWIHSPGEGYGELGVRHLSGGAFYDSTGESKTIASQYSQTTLTTYAEVGVVERWLQVSLSGELYRRNELADQGATRGLGDLQLGVFSGLVQGPHLNASVGLRLGLPTGDPSPTSGLDDPQADIIAASLPTGSGALSLIPTAALGVGFGGGRWPLDHYLSTTAGYVAWVGFVDSYVWSAELGTRIRAKILDRLTLRLRLAGTGPVGEVEVASFSGVGEGVTFVSFGYGAAVEIWRGVGISATRETAFVARNIISATPFALSVFWSF